jgi:hypothetical protein
LFVVLLFVSWFDRHECISQVHNHTKNAFTLLARPP